MRERIRSVLVITFRVMAVIIVLLMIAAFLAFPASMASDEEKKKVEAYPKYSEVKFEPNWKDYMKDYFLYMGIEVVAGGVFGAVVLAGIFGDSGGKSIRVTINGDTYEGTVHRKY